ncbi:uncharacterized protein LOC124273433 [Haliotis rubra]|uniref:uncharacterized protein LOC124273433 n=1 Tax=Haliotis rubra TaxID=36100 RepID=UPI001EE5507E|nr:uncharacterized protein LOC124273433 [Haliotis rubra]
MRNMLSKADKIENLQGKGSVEASFDSMLKESPHEIPFDRTGISFVHANVKQLRGVIKVTGMVRTVTFTPTERPECVPDSATYNAIILEPAEMPSVTEMDRMVSDEEITYPTLEWDSSTADKCLDVSECVITNITPAVLSPNSGCRILNCGLCLASRPLVVRRGQRCMFRVKFSFSMKKFVGSDKLVQEIALTPFPVEASRSQLIGLSVNVSTCSNHKEKLCLRVDYNRYFLTDIPITPIRVGRSYDLQLDFLLDGADDRMFVIDAVDKCVYTTVRDVEFDRPIWVMTCLGLPTTADVIGELITGHSITDTFTL